MSDEKTRSLEADSSDTGSARTLPATPETPSVEPSLASGDCVGRYTIGERLGAGGMGDVYAAHDPELDRKVAVKVLRSTGGAVSSTARARFQREAMAMARLNHPNVVSVFDVGTVGKRFFVAMELVDGPTLDRWLTSEPRGWRDIVSVFLDAARGLAAAHAAGIIHRDFKPSNVLIGDRVRVADFGLARLYLEEGATGPVPGTMMHVAVTQDGAVVGTPAYMAPEQLAGLAPTAASDQYSFCVALHEALFGARPGSDASVPPQRVPRWLRAICDRGLAKRPEDRFASMEALIAELGRNRNHRLVYAMLVGIAVVAAIVWQRPRPETGPDLKAVTYAALDAESSIQQLTVSGDGKVIAYLTRDAIWVEPHAGGARTTVRLPPELGPSKAIALSGNGDTVTAWFEPEGQPVSIWSFEVKTGAATKRKLPSDEFRWESDGRNGDLIGVLPDQTVVSVDRNGDTKTIYRGRGTLFRVALSPDGSRFAAKEYREVVPHLIVFAADDGRITHDIAHDCRFNEWMSASSIGCIEVRDGTPVLTEITPRDDGSATTRDRWVAPIYSYVVDQSVSSEGMLVDLESLEERIGVADLDRSKGLSSVASGSTSDSGVAGWTSSGSLIFGANMHGRLQIMALRPDGGIDTVRKAPQAEMPLVVLGEDILFGRFPGGEPIIPRADEVYGRRYPDLGELYRLRVSGELVDLGPTHGFIDLRCAGDRQPPCVVIEHTGDEARAVAIDPETGARGSVRATWSLNSERYPALAPDGRTLASVRMPDKIRLLDLDSGAETLSSSVFKGIHHLSWDAEGALIGDCRGDGQSSVLCRYRDGKAEPFFTLSPDRRWTLEPRISLDGKRFATPQTDTRRDTWVWLPYDRASK